MAQITARARSRGFTLLELLLVVIILAILAAVVLGRAHNGAAHAGVSAVARNLTIMRAAIQRYTIEHGDQYPGDEVALQLTGITNAAGEIIEEDEPGLDPSGPPTGSGGLVVTGVAGGPASAGAPSGSSAGRTYGPYLRGSIPTNLLNGSKSVKVVDTMPEAASGPRGWVYAKDSGQIRANVSGLTPSGVLYFDL